MYNLLKIILVIKIIITMCGIWLLLTQNTITTGQKSAFDKTKPRGPDESKIVSIQNNETNIYIGFHRLAIHDLSHNGMQPFIINQQDRTIYVICNGEIYTYKELEKLLINYHPQSKSDCEVLGYLYLQYGNKFVDKLQGCEFALCIIDINVKTNQMKILCARDHYGVRPLYHHITDNEVVFSSELRSNPFLFDKSNVSNQFMPGALCVFNDFKSLCKSKEPDYIRYYQCENIEYRPDITFDESLLLIKNTLSKCVIEKLSADVEIGALLSGGLDSSLVCSIASKYLREQNKYLTTFSIGLPGSTDKYYAELASKFIDSIHYHVEFDTEQFLQALKDVIYTLGTYDITTIRASVGQYLISKYISENTNIKVLLIGDGSDELTSGYLYTHNAPNEYELHDDNIFRLKDICKYDGKRADRCIATHGLEARMPFLDNRFCDLYLSLNKKSRMATNGIEKYLLRKAFDNNEYLPDEILYRKKEAFSDGVSSVEKSWYQIIQENVENIISNEELLSCNYTHNKPLTKEALYYRKIFETYYGNNDNVIPYYWMPKWTEANDPSARTLTKIY